MQDFINTYNGKFLTVTGPDAGQCTAVAHRWEQLQGTPLVFGNAVDMYANAGPEYVKIANTPDNFPQPGDQVIWQRNSVAGTGNPGHVAVAVSADSHTFTSFDQNWPTGSVCRLVHHSYDGVIGWIRPKNNQPQGEQPMTDQQEQDAYRIVLGRTRETGPSGRTALQFIYDAQQELSDVRSGTQATIVDLQKKLQNTGGVDETTKAQISETNSIVKAIRDLLGRIFK